MIKRLARMLCALCFLVLAGPPPTRAAPVITLVPMPTTINPPANLSIDVDISGLRSGGQNIILGAFDLTINFDPDVLEFLQIGSHFGTGLGDPGDPLQTAVGGDLSPGSFRFFEVSLLDASTLEALQSDSFSLATLLFYAPGTSPRPPFTDLPLSPACSASSTPPGCSILSDADGNDINNFGIVNARVDIPEPSTILLLLVALAGAICCIQRTVFTRFRGTIAARCLLRSSIVIAFWVTFMMSEAAQAQTTYQIPLKSGTIVLQKTQFPAAAPRVAVPATSQYMIIQFERNLRSSDIDGLRMTGISPLTLVFANAWLCNVRFGALTASAAATYGIAAAAQWLPDHKIEPRLRQGQIDDWAKTANGDVKLLVKFFEDVDSDTAKAVLRSYSSSPRFFGAPNTWAIETPPSAIQTLMNEPLVQSIEQGPRPFEPTNDASRAILNVDAVQLADLSKTPPVYRGLSGSGVNIQVSEYVSTNHPDFLSHDAAGNPTTSRFLNPLPSAQTGSPHGTHVAGTIGGNGWASDKGINGGTPYQWRGMAPESTLISGHGYGTYPVHVSNHSYVLSYGQYESGVQQVDRDIRGADGLAFQRPHVWAAANQGITAQYGSETGYYSVYAPSKNALVVGAVNSNDGSLASFSSLGPTFDGRIKPDVVSPGCTNTISPDFGYDQLMTMQIDYMRIYDGATLVKGWEFDTPSDFGGWFDTFNVDGYGYGPSNLQNWE